MKIWLWRLLCPYCNLSISERNGSVLNNIDKIMTKPDQTGWEAESDGEANETKLFCLKSKV